MPAPRPTATRFCWWNGRDGRPRPVRPEPSAGFTERLRGELAARLGSPAISGVCTHLGCTLALDGPARELRCPCHSAAFTLTGTVRSHPRTGTLPPLPRIPVRESGGAVQVFTAVAPC